MRTIRRSIALVTIMSLLCTAATVQAYDGDGYQDSSCCKIGPEWALGVGGLALAGIIVGIAVSKDSSSHSHR